MKTLATLLALLPCLAWAQGPYAPAAGQSGSTAISKDSSIFSAWADQCQLMRGYFNIADKDSTVTHGTASDASGMADGQVVSLGDSGVTTLTFAEPIYDGPGFDFAVFENSFSDTYLELAFVEVSSDGINFVRFPSVSLTPTTAQTGSFGPTDPTDIYNLAGKYRGGFGVPFDLSELKDSSALDVNAITHVRIVDVIGTVDPALGSRDSEGRVVNDPYPTIFASGGFDLDAVGVIHSGEIGLKETAMAVEIYPNPAANYMLIRKLKADFHLEVFSINGRQLLEQHLSAHQENRISVEHLGEGIYFLHLKREGENFTKKIVVGRGGGG